MTSFPEHTEDLLARLAAGTQVPLFELRLEAMGAIAGQSKLIARYRAEREACAPYLKPGETPAERIKREIEDCCAAGERWAKEKSRAEAAEAEVARLRSALEDAGKNFLSCADEAYSCGFETVEDDARDAYTEVCDALAKGSANA